ncbi:coiled-coil domain-containing protein 137 isoform X3 [Scyliorhinus canicula]|uniref:coiled-coil domain-containing protein 137 isoform X3 n=1 Tax=Scyliorhinus canicula TaxID=7830 RepID=UPI0018F296F1|nr:coiled-coil domain-containing protein 137 isoform X3 [Scyliorhinus canicula]
MAKRRSGKGVDTGPAGRRSGEGVETRPAGRRSGKGVDAGPAERQRGKHVEAGRRKEPRHSEPKKFNMKPKNIDEQEIPYKVREIMRSREKMVKKMNKQKRKPEKPAKKPASVGSGLHQDIPVPKFKRRKREPESAYIQRMEEETQHVMFLTKTQLTRCPELDNEEEEQASSVKTKSERKKEHDKKRLGKFIRKKAERREMKLEKEMFTGLTLFCRYCEIWRSGHAATYPHG